MRIIHRPQLWKSWGIYRVILQRVWQNAHKKIFRVPQIHDGHVHARLFYAPYNLRHSLFYAL